MGFIPEQFQKIRRRAFLFSFLTGMALFFLFGVKLKKKRKDIHLLITTSWGKSLHPGYLHTLGGDLVLSNQFEPLVGTDNNGVIIPLAANSWGISEDHHSLFFEINQNMFFSDGSKLTAHDFKRSWEESLKQVPWSANGSLQDLLYKLVGYNEFRERGEITGIQVQDDYRLTLRFNSPFRMALDHLTGVRFSAHKTVDGKTIGTGRFVITSFGENSLRLVPNPHHSDPSLHPVVLEFSNPDHLIRQTQEPHVDGVAYAFGDEIENDVTDKSNFEIIYGQDALHQVVEVNGVSSPLFNSSENRLAIQYLLTEAASREIIPWNSNGFSRIDFQSFVPLQAGRLEDADALKIIKGGEQFVSKLRTDSKKHPIRFLGTNGINDLIRFLLEQDITVSTKSSTLSWGQTGEYHYKRNDYDLLYGAFSVVNGDPDGIYHALGRNGAIANPVTFRPVVTDLLEEGRKLIGQERLNLHYQMVGRAILSEVPFIHLGYTKSLALFKKERISGAKVNLRRNQGQVHVFEVNDGTLV